MRRDLDNACCSAPQVIKEYIDSDLDLTKKSATTWKELDKSESLTCFLETHCKLGTYKVTIMKCADPSCKFHKPRRLSAAEWSDLHMFPDAQLTTNGSKVSVSSHFPRPTHTLHLLTLSCARAQFKSFSEVWGTLTTEADYPSRKVVEGQKEDKASKKVLHSKYAVHFFTCTQPSCRKPRVLYKATPLDAEQKEALVQAEDHFLYTCGGPVTASTDPLHGRVVARSTICCSDPVEFAYYSKHAHFPLCCSTCGVRSTPNNKLARDPERLALYKVVLPQCERCFKRRLVPPSRINLHFTPRPREAHADSHGVAEHAT